MHTYRKPIIHAGLLGIIMLLPVTALFTACQEEPVVVDVTLESNMNGIAEAILQTNATLEEKLAAIESASKNGLTGNNSYQDLIRSAIASLSGTLEENLAAIEGAVKSQTTSLETKLIMIEAAVQAGFASCAEQQMLLQKAIASLGGTLTEKLSAVEKAIQSQTVSLETKIGLVDAAVKEGLAGNASAGDLIKEAIESLGGTLSDKTAAVEKAIASETAEFSAKLGLIETAVKEGFDGEKTLPELIKSALESLGGTMEEKFSAIEKAVTSQTASLETKLGLIEEALKENLSDASAGQELVGKAIETLEGTLKKKMEELEQAVTSQTSSLDTYLSAIEQALSQGFTDSKGQQELIRKAVESLGDKSEEVLGKLQEAMTGKLSGLDSKLKAIGEAVTGGLSDTNEALGLIKGAIVSVQESIAAAGTSTDSVKTALEDVVKAIQATDKTISDEAASVMTDILDAIADQQDLSGLFQSLVTLIETFLPATITFDKYVSEESGEAMLYMPESYTLDVPYTLSSDSNISVRAIGGVNATVIPDTGNPLKGVINIVSPATIEDGKSKVEVNIKMNKRTLHIGKVDLSPITNNHVDIIPKGCAVEFEYRTNVPVTISMPDTCDWARPVWGISSSAKADSVIHVMVDPNKGARIRRTSVTALDIFGVNSITFYIYQDADNDPIVFADIGLKQYLLVNKKVNLNGDSEISKAEAAAVKSLETLFDTGLTQGRDYIRFNEFQYFTGITELPKGSFNNWRYMDSICMPASIKKVGGKVGVDTTGVLQNCPALKAMNGKDYWALDGVLYKVAESLSPAREEHFEIPDGVQTIGLRAFYRSKVKHVGFPNSLQRIRDKAFEYSKIKDIVFPCNGDYETGEAYVDSISESAFNHCFSLQSFTGPTGPKKKNRIRVLDHRGVYQDTVMLAFALASAIDTFSIPPSLDIRKLAYGLFSMDGGGTKGIPLEKLGLPNTITHIGPHAFSRQKDMEVYFYYPEDKWQDATVVRPPDVVEGGAFDHIDSDSNFYFYVPDAGSESENKDRAKLFHDKLSKSVPIKFYTEWPFGSYPIKFTDASFKAKLISNGVDTDGDGEITCKEARAVTTVEALLGSSLQDASFTSFDEFRYFTGIKILPAGSFNGWTNLTSITLPASIETIDISFKDKAGTTTSPEKTVFYNCPKLNYIKGKFASEDENALIYKRNGETTSKLVKVCETLSAFYIPEGIDTIARYCFYHSKAKMVQFPKSLKVIGDCAFEHSAIENVNFPLGDGSSKANPDVDTCRVTTVYDRSFAHCYNLKAFSGARVNGKLKVCAEDRVLYRDTTVYAYALGSAEKKVVIPDDKSIKRLADCVFEMVSPEGTPLPADQSILEIIALPTGINRIGERTFFNQAKLEKMYFHGSVVPAICGAQALGHIESMYVFVPEGSDLEAWSQRLNYDYGKVITWMAWTP